VKTAYESIKNLRQLNMVRTFQRGEIWLANLNPNKGKEPGKIRPVLIIQNQSLLETAHPTTLIIPLTTQLKENLYPLRVRIPNDKQLEKNSDALIDQIRTIDNKRLIRGPLTTCQPAIMYYIDRAINEVMGLSSVFTGNITPKNEFYLAEDPAFYEVMSDVLAD